MPSRPDASGPDCARQFERKLVRDSEFIELALVSLRVIPAKAGRQMYLNLPDSGRASYRQLARNDI